MAQTNDQKANAKPTRQAVAKGNEAYSPHAIHLLRTAQVNTLTLSQMADQKASILMGATFLVFSLTVSRALVGEVSMAMLVLAFTAFVSSLCAVFAVIPSVGRPGQFQGPSNKLFFGHFSGRNEEEWTQDVLDELHHDDDVFRMMLHDIYQNGSVLQRRKYRFLTIAYRLFIFGLFATMCIYVAELSGILPV